MSDASGVDIRAFYRYFGGLGFHQQERIQQDFINGLLAVPCTRQGFVLRTGAEYGAGDWDVAGPLQGDVRPDQQTCRDHRVELGD